MTASFAFAPATLAITSTLMALLVLLLAEPTNAIRYMGLEVATQSEVMEGWRKKTGKTLEVVFKPVPSIIEEAQLDMKQGINSFDVYQIHQSMTPFAEKKWIREITEDVKQPRFKWDDIALASRKWQTEYNGGAWSVPIDSDSYLLYYRRDLIASPPNTWEEYIQVAKEWHGKDINGDGIPDFGACTITKGQFTNLAYTIAATVMKFKKGNRQGFAHDVSDRDDELMKDLLETEGWAYTMELVKQIWQYGQGFDVAVGDVFGQFRDGRCATYISYPSAGTQTVADNSYIFGKLGVARAPGSSKVFDRETSSLVPCNPDLCSFIEAGNVNRPSFITGGVMLIVNGNLEGQALDDALDFCAYATNNVDVRKPGGINPYRESHFNATWFTEAAVPWNKQDAELYTAALRQVIDFPHTVAAPRTPNGQIIYANVERAMKEYVRLEPYNTSTDDLPTIMKNCIKRINEESVADGYTPEILENALRVAMGLPTYTPPKEETKEFPYWVISIIIVVIALVATAAYFHLQKAMKTANAPKNESEGFAALFIGPKNISELWQRYPEQVPEAQTIFKDRVRQAIRKNKCYEARRIGDFFLIVSVDPARLVNTATEISEEMDNVLWSEIFTASAGKNSTQQNKKRKATRGGGDDTNSSHSRRSRRSEGNASQRSSMDGGNNSNQAWSDSGRYKISAGFSFGRGRIAFDEELNHYDYTGAVVEDAAHVADVAQPLQMLATETVSNVIDENDAHIRGKFVQFCEKKLNGSNVTEQLMQFNMASSIPKTFAVPSDDGEIVDSVMQALEQASGGLSQKRVTVLHVIVSDFVKDVSTKGRDAVTRKYKELYDLVIGEVVANRGFIHRFQEGEFVITFNAVQPTAGHTFRAGICAMDIVNTLRENDYVNISCGFDTGVAWVGKMPSGTDQPPHYAIVGTVATCARNFAVRCDNHGDDDRINCLTSSRFKEDFSSSLLFHYVDIVRPIVSSSGSAGQKPLGLLSIAGRKKSDENDSDEWIYELQNQDIADPFLAINKCFDHLLNGDNANAQELLSSSPAGGEDLGLQQDFPRLVKRAEAILSAGNLESYLKNSA